jgi:hypothetical protein
MGKQHGATRELVMVFLPSRGNVERTSGRGRVLREVNFVVVAMHAASCYY